VKSGCAIEVRRPTPEVRGMLVWKLDRWGRSVAYCVRSIQELLPLAILFLRPTASIDTAGGQPHVQVPHAPVRAFAEMERGIIRGIIRERV
jgi:DNA invertase Pin-like site-specific DNA recombinase